MILQALTAYYEQLLKQGKVEAPGWDSKFKVSYELRLGPDGQLLALNDLRQEVPKGKKTVIAPRELPVPHRVKRASGVAANFLCDNTSYLLGADEKGKPERSRQCFEACAALHHKVLDGVDSPAAKAILAFFDSWKPDTAPTHPLLAGQWADLNNNANLVFGYESPNMATMLAFYTTDAAVSPALLEKALKTVVPGTYNQMSVDLDTSTNDTLIIMASGLAGNPEITEENADYDAFVAALTAIAEHMCAEHAGDGEGATHLITCEVTHAPDLKTARAVSRSVVCSNLFKAAVFGRDANWGRILCAIGYTPGDFSIDKVCVWLSSKAGEVYVCENAAYHPYSEDEAAKVLAEHDILVKVDMGTGDASAKAWGCDLTYDYVKINGDYRT